MGHSEGNPLFQHTVLGSNVCNTAAGRAVAEATPGNKFPYSPPTAKQRSGPEGAPLKTCHRRAAASLVAASAS